MSEEETRSEIAGFRKFATQEFLKIANNLGGIANHLIQLNSYNKECKRTTREHDERIKLCERGVESTEKGFTDCKESHKDIATNKEKKSGRTITIIAVGTSIIIGIFLIADKIIAWAGK